MSTLSFHYTALKPEGGRTRGTLRAIDQAEAIRLVRAAGLQPIRIRLRHQRLGASRRRRVSAKELAHLTCQFSVLMEARVSIADGLRSIAEQESNPRLQFVINDVARQIEAGNTITDSMRPHRQVFGEIYLETIHAAEVSGNLTEVLAHLAEMLDRQYETIKNVRGALIYPACVLTSLLLGVTFLLIFVIPRFSSMFESRGLQLPMVTRVLVQVGDFAATFWPMIGVGLVGGWLGLKTLWRHPVWRQRIDQSLHRIPYIRDLLVGMAIARLTHVFGLSLRSGIGLIDALEVAGNACGRPMLMRDVDRMREQVKHGGRLADVLFACPYLPGFARRMLIAGEEAAEMPRMCRVVARHYDREVMHLAKNMATFIEPVMIIGLAATVLVIALAIFIPMWNMGSLIG